ncbi:alanine racemase [Prochlorococcus marinus]|uniref:alanine racemase n=1 Tax=Prochlorococcus marinus TaxID=1219 RepID=UPI0022B4DC9B|nr:alanine racemase [Prochlorococcus marinus]
MLFDKIDPRQRAWVEVFPSAITQNTLAIKSLLSDSCLLMAVVKADGYGHGSETVASAALRGGADSLGVATLQEGIDLRKVGLICPILVLGNLVTSEELDICLKADLMPTISCIQQIKLCQKIAEANSTKFNVHIKIDTGMTRLGCDLAIASELIYLIDNLPNIILKGIYSHLALADGESDNYAEKFTSLQKTKFEKFISHVADRSHSCCIHLANSAGTFLGKELHFDMVRIGLALYGYSPLKKFQNNVFLQPALAVRAKVTLIRDVPSNVGVSYGHTFKTKSPSRLAVVGIGYADGVNRALSGKISVLIDGKFYPQVGSITMDQLVVDITENPHIKVGSVVTLLGPDGKACISPFQWSSISGSIPWEILCGFKYRLPRVVI